jgi:site-specific recombinase XerD
LTQWAEPPQVLDHEMVEHLLGSVDRSTALGKRNYAMLLLAARYGLRASDIRSLHFEDVRWREQRIAILQSKTQRLLELPLLADVEEALVDYLRTGRPECPERVIFVRHPAPIRALAPRNGLWTVMQRALKAAGMKLDHPQRGLHLLRHSLATRMLTKGVALKTIADLLGHDSMETTRRYAQVDLAGLRSVALSEAEVSR